MTMYIRAVKKKFAFRIRGGENIKNIDISINIDTEISERYQN